MVLGHNFADPRDKTMYADNRSPSPQKKKNITNTNRLQKPLLYNENRSRNRK